MGVTEILSQGSASPTTRVQILFGIRLEYRRARRLCAPRQATGWFISIVGNDTKILRESWGSIVLVPLYDNEDSVCGKEVRG